MACAREGAHRRRRCRQPGRFGAATNWDVARIHADTYANKQATDDRIGQSTMRNLGIADTRAKLGIYSRAGLLGEQSEGSLPLLTGDAAEK